MIEYVNRKLEQLADELLTPFWNALLGWLRNLSWWGRTTFLVTLLTGIAVYWWPSLPATAGRFVTVATSEPGVLPLNSSIAARLHETATRLSHGLQSDLEDPRSIDPPSAWTLALVIIATNEMETIDRDTIRTYLRSISMDECNCWQERPVKSDPPHTTASGSVLFAMADMGIPAREAEIRFLLGGQQQKGWWSLFPSTGDEQYASTYATSWALLGLQRQLSAKLLAKPLSDSVSAAIAKGCAWLVSHRESGSARWKNYPLLASGTISESISGLALHVLREATSNSMSQLQQRWLEELPIAAPTAVDHEIPDIWIKSTTGHHHDHFVQIKLPWMLIATADAYESGDWLQRTHALGWIERAVRHDSLLNADTDAVNWMRAEILLSIKYLLNKASRAKLAFST